MGPEVPDLLIYPKCDTQTSVSNCPDFECGLFALLLKKQIKTPGRPKANTPVGWIQPTGHWVANFFLTRGSQGNILPPRGQNLWKYFWWWSPLGMRLASKGGEPGTFCGLLCTAAPQFFCSTQLPSLPPDHDTNGFFDMYCDLSLDPKSILCITTTGILHGVRTL